MRTIRFFLPLAMLALLSVGNATTTQTARHATALAAAAGMDLCLDHPDRTAKLLRSLDRFFDIEAWDTPWHRHTIALQDFFALILVDFHGDLGWVTYAALMLSQRS